MPRVGHPFFNERVRQRAHDVLARSEFARHESLLQRFLDWLNDLLNKGKISENVPLRPGDILVIPETLF